jgi:cytochrome c oxidase subunit 2
VGPRRRSLPLWIALVTGLVAVLAGAPAASADALWPEAGGSPNADDTRDLYAVVSLLGLLIFIGVEFLLFYCLRNYRAKKGAVAAQIHGNTRLEIAWTVAAALILVFITTVTFIELPAIKNPPASDIDRNGNPIAANFQVASTDQPAPPRPQDAMTIQVDGQQYLWRYQYPGRERVFSYVDLVVPAGVTVILEITSDDVQHSWWIPALGGKMDALPGYTNRAWFKARPGTYEGQCAELCGRNHANMIARVRALPFREYRAWYAGKVREIEADRQAAARQRRQLEREQGEQAAQGGGAAGGAGPANPNQSGDASSD